MRLLGRRRKRPGPEHEKPGLGAVILEEIKAGAEVSMAGFDSLPQHLRELIHSASSIGDAAYFWSQGIRTFDEAEDYIAKSICEKPKHKRVTEPTYLFQE